MPLLQQMGKINNYHYDLVTAYNCEIVMLNNYKGQQSTILNLLLITLKQYMCQNVSKKSPDTVLCAKNLRMVFCS